ECPLAQLRAWLVDMAGHLGSADARWCECPGRAARKGSPTRGTWLSLIRRMRDYGMGSHGHDAELVTGVTHLLPCSNIEDALNDRRRRANGSPSPSITPAALRDCAATACSP